MNIGYVAFLPQGSPSVEMRVIERAQAALELAGKELQFFVIGQPRRVPAKPLPNLHYIEIPRSYASRVLALLMRYRIIERVLNDFDLDAIVIRYPGADISAMRFFANRAVITEHHTSELQEKMAMLRCKRGLKRQTARVRFQFEKWYGGHIRNASRGFIGVTEEVRAVQVSRASRPHASTVIPNGVDTGRFMHTQFVPFDGRALKLAFVSSSFEKPWYGVDRLLAGIRKYQGPVQIQLHIVGKADERTVRDIEATTSSVRFHGEKYGQDLDDLLGRMTLGVSSLALHRNNMQEACTLKTREYTARGLPFVLGYQDPDLAGCSEGEEFFLKLPNDDSPVEIENLVQFAARMADCPDVSDRMRRFAHEHMDWKRKMTDLYDFVVAVTEGRGAKAGLGAMDGRSLADRGAGWANRVRRPPRRGGNASSPHEIPDASSPTRRSSRGQRRRQITEV